MTDARPECRDSSNDAFPDLHVLRSTYRAVKKRRGLVYGKLNAEGGHCALGCFWEDNNGAVRAKLVNEIAAVNDSVPPTAGRRERRAHVLRWLEWKLGINQ